MEPAAVFEEIPRAFGLGLAMLFFASLIAGCSSHSDQVGSGESDGPVTEAISTSESADVLDRGASEDIVSAPAQVPPLRSPVSDSAPAVPDFAEADGGGPDFWAVSGVASNDSLNIRDSAVPTGKIVGSVPNGTVLRNLGCRSISQSRWCRVGSLADDGVDGWVNARFLHESGPPMTRPVPAKRPTDGSRPSADGVPELARRNNGEYEVRFAGGCIVLLDGGVKVLTRGSTCSTSQISRAVRAVEGYRREQGL